VALTELAQWAASDPAERLFDRLQATVVELKSHHDGLQERAEAIVSWRLPLAWPPERFRAALAEMPVWGRERVAWGLAGSVGAVRSPPDGRLARLFRAAIRRVGGEPGRKVKTGTSDWNVVAPSWSCDALAYGPGDAALDHTPEEQLNLAEFDRAVTVLDEVVQRLAGA